MACRREEWCDVGDVALDTSERVAANDVSDAHRWLVYVLHLEMVRSARFGGERLDLVLTIHQAGGMRHTARLVRGFTVAAFVAASQVALAFAASRRVSFALGVAALSVAGVFGMVLPASLALLVWPATWISQRVGPASFDLSVTDALLFVAGLSALPAIAWRSAPVRKVVTGLVMYQAMLLITVLANPSTRAGLEWLHRIQLVLGALAVGVALAHHGRVRLALRLFLLTSCVFAAASIVNTVTRHWEPAYPFGAHKNAAGSLLALAILVALLARGTHGWGGTSLTVLQVTLFGGLLATQARGAALALIVTVALVAGYRQRPKGVRAVAFVGGVALLAMLAATYVTRDAKQPHSDFNSINSRRITYGYALDLWKTEPLTGVGLRFWNDPSVGFEGRPTFGEPHNFVVSALGETGIIGLAALAILLWQMFGALRLVGGELGRLAKLAFVGLLVDSLFGILWVAGTFTARMVIIGMAIGVAATHHAPEIEVIDLREPALAR